LCWYPSSLDRRGFCQRLRAIKHKPIQTMGARLHSKYMNSGGARDLLTRETRAPLLVEPGPRRPESEVISTVGARPARTVRSSRRRISIETKARSRCTHSAGDVNRQQFMPANSAQSAAYGQGRSTKEMTKASSKVIPLRRQRILSLDGVRFDGSDAQLELAPIRPRGGPVKRSLTRRNHSAHFAIRPGGFGEYLHFRNSARRVGVHLDRVMVRAWLQRAARNRRLGGYAGNHNP